MNTCFIHQLYIGLRKKIPLHKFKSKLCTRLFKDKIRPKIWLRKMRACFMLALNESAHRKGEFFDLEYVYDPVLDISTFPK